MEIAPRVAGTMALCRMQGVNLPLLSLYDAMGRDITILKNNFEIEIDRALAAKFKIDMQYETVYVDLDDTIILDSGHNYLLIGLLYKFVNLGKKIILITKHIKVVRDTLSEHRLSLNLFDEIIAIKSDDRKSEYIKGPAIFIDDSFAERHEVSEKHGLPVFDISEAVELL